MEILKNKTLAEALELCERPTITEEQIIPVIDGIFDEVRKNGDSALIKYTHFFDKVNLTELRVSQKEIDAAEKSVSEELKEAIQVAKANIEQFHRSQELVSSRIETMPGVTCWQEARGIEKVGIYIPGGSAPLFSTVLMLATPAQIAGCKEIILCTPPNKSGEINPAILYTASITGVTQIFKVGGAQAIGALTFGTESIPKVYKIFGPGNQYVTCAKMRAQQYGVAIDMPAGPSELLVVADDSANPSFIASDLLSQAEHGADSQVICVVDSEALANSIKKEVFKQLEDLPRKGIAEKALKNSKFLISSGGDYTFDFLNEYAPEHLIIAIKDANESLARIQNAGSVFIGNYTPESAGDYASGTNHTLPTGGFAKAYSGVNLDAFTKKITCQEITKEGIRKLGKTIELMAEAEGLQAHKNAVTLRLNEVKS